MRLFIAGLRKLIRRPASWYSLIALIALQGLIFIAVGATADETSGGGEPDESLLLLTFPIAYDQVLNILIGFGGLLAVIYGAAIAGSEWTWGTLKTVVARGESRSRYALASFAAIAALLAIGLLLAFAAGVASAWLGAQLAGISTAGMSYAESLRQLPGKLFIAWLGVTSLGALGFAIATLARSQLAGIGVGVGFFFGENILRIFLPEVVKHFPFAVAIAATSPVGGMGSEAGIFLPPDIALLAVLAWLFGSLLVAAIVTERAEISG